MTEQSQVRLTGPADTVTLHNGVHMPVLGFGVFQTSGRETRTAVTTAIRAGYRMIDTASVYGNETDVGHGLDDSGLRDEVFITTKLWNSDHGYDRTLAAFERSRQRLGTDVVDLFLVHWPVPRLRLDTWRALEHLLDEGRVRAIGISNYMAHHLEELLAVAQHPPTVNQIELSPYNYGSRADVLRLCQDNGIVVQSFSPLTKGLMLNDPPLVAIAKRHGRSTAQVLISWALEKGFVPLPKSTNPGRIANDADVFDVKLSDQDVATLDGLDRNLVTVPQWDPTTAP